jgi:DedD protein
VAAPPRPAAKAGGPPAWVVQAGSFGNAKNALGLRDKLRAAGYPAFVEKLEESGSAASYRVRIGPEGDRSAADTLRAKVEKEFTLKAIVMGHP